MSKQENSKQAMRDFAAEQLQLHVHLSKLKFTLMQNNLLSESKLYAHGDGCMTIAQKRGDNTVALHHLTQNEVMERNLTILNTPDQDRGSLIKTVLEETFLVTYDYQWAELFDPSAKLDSFWFMYKDMLEKFDFSSNMVLIAKFD